MKTLMLAAVMAAVGTPAMAAHGWGNGYNQTGGCQSSYQNYGRAAYSSGYPGSGYGANYGYGTSYGRGYMARDPWSYRSVTPSMQGRGTYDPYHGDFHVSPNSGFGSSFPRNGIDSRFYDHGGY